MDGAVAGAVPHLLDAAAHQVAVRHRPARPRGGGGERVNTTRKSEPVHTSEPTRASLAARQRRGILITVIVLALVALSFFISAFFKPWQ